MYYNVIKRPIALETIRSGVVKGTYSSLGTFSADVMLVFKNARSFNEPSCALYKNARFLQQVRLPSPVTSPHKNIYPHNNTHPHNDTQCTVTCIHITTHIHPYTSTHTNACAAHAQT